MSESRTKTRWRGPVKLSDVIGRVLDPVTARRGLGTADLIAAWPAIIGARFAEFTRPEKIAWPRGGDDAATAPGTLVLRAEGPRAVLVQHEAAQIIEKVNGFLGYAAVGRVRIVQAPVAANDRPPPPSPPALSAEDDARLDEAVARVEDDRLREALGRLGRGVLSRG